MQNIGKIFFMCQNFKILRFKTNLVVTRSIDQRFWNEMVFCLNHTSTISQGVLHWASYSASPNLNFPTYKVIGVLEVILRTEQSIQSAYLSYMLLHEYQLNCSCSLMHSTSICVVPSMCQKCSEHWGNREDIPTELVVWRQTNNKIYIYIRKCLMMKRTMRKTTCDHEIQELCQYLGFGQR